MVVSNEVYSPQAFLEKATGRTYLFDGSIDNDKDFIIDVLMSTKGGFYFNLSPDDKRLQSWYDLEEINYIVKNDIDVVLVQCCCYNEIADCYESRYYWFVVDGSLDW